jgi:hypothetical protein
MRAIHSLLLLALHILAPVLFVQPASAKAAAPPRDTARLERQTEDEYDRIVEGFILYDTGKLRGAESTKALVEHL